MPGPGSCFQDIQLPDAKIFAGGKDFCFLISDGKTLVLVKDSESLWSGALQNEDIRDIKYDENSDLFLILGNKSISSFSPASKKIATVFASDDLSCFEVMAEKIIAGTSNGYH